LSSYKRKAVIVKKDQKTFVVSSQKRPEKAGAATKDEFCKTLDEADENKNTAKGVAPININPIVEVDEVSLEKSR